jgi:apolipoprotein N-acyltransferase
MIPGVTAARAADGSWQRLGVALSRLAGWRRLGLSAALGVLAAAALPPVHALPVLPIAFAGLLWLLDGCSTRRGAFALGWSFGFGHFVAGLYWVSESLLIEPEKFAWLIPFAVSCIPAYLALYTGAVTLLVHLSAARGVRRVLVFAAAWAAMEWLRGVLFTGFPWNPLALSLTVSDAAVQLAAVLGVFGLSFVLALVAAAPSVLATPAGAPRWTVVGAAALLLAAVWAGGALRLAAAPSAAVPGVVLRVVQGNIAQRIKWLPGLRDRHLARYLRLSTAPDGTAGKPTHLIWPETAVPVIVARDEVRRRLMGSVTPADGLLFTGTLRTGAEAARPFRVWNSMQVVDATGRLRATYDKFHLVPFGEYVPLRGLLGRLGLEAVAAERADFTAGPGPRTLRLAGLPPVSPLICYEAIFPSAVADARDRPGWLLNLTNDAWFGMSAGPYQHFASARLRAVEEGLPLVRAANTGISGVVDGYGRVTAWLGLGRTGVLDAPLPAALAATPFSRFGHAPLALVLAVALAAGLWRGTARPDQSGSG